MTNRYVLYSDLSTFWGLRFSDPTFNLFRSVLVVPRVYSGVLKSGHVRILNCQSLSGFRMVRVLNGSFSLDIIVHFYSIFTIARVIMGSVKKG